MIKRFFLEKFILAMALCVAAGLVLPWIEGLPRYFPLMIIAVAMFYSCSKVSVEELKQMQLVPALMFYVLRFVLLPVPFFYAAKMVAPDYALGTLLLVLSPVGVASTAIAAMVRANASVVLSATMLTHALTPVMIPLFVYVLGGSVVDVDPYKMGGALGAGIFLPAVLYFFGVRCIAPLKAYVHREADFMMSLCIGLLIVVITGFERDYILTHPWQVFLMAVGSFVVVAVPYIVAWGYALRMGVKDRKTYMICSGVTNTSLAAAIAALYFPSQTVVYTIVIEIPFVIALMAFMHYARRGDE